MRNLILACVVMSWTVCHVAAAHAEPITIFGTGVDSLGNLLTPGTIDPHYHLAMYPGQVGDAPANAYVLNVSSTYNLSGTDSRWISWSSVFTNATPGGLWIYRTTFDLAGFDPSTAILTGRVYADDFLQASYLNGVDTGIVGGSYLTGTPFTIATGFAGGVNTLDFQVPNANFVAFNPSAFRLDISGTARAVPEPSTIALAILGIAGALISVAGRRRISLVPFAPGLDANRSTIT